LKRLFVGNLPADANEVSLTNLFADFGKVHSVQLVSDLFSGKCKGFGFVGMEGHEARAAIIGLDGKMYCGKPLKVKFEETTTNRSGRR